MMHKDKIGFYAFSANFLLSASKVGPAVPFPELITILKVRGLNNPQTPNLFNVGVAGCLFIYYSALFRG